MSEKRYIPRYSGPNCSGICICGHSFDEHHLGMVLNPEYLQQTGEFYIPEECEHYGFNETGGLDKDGKEHCFKYRDEKWPEEGHN